MHGVIQRFVGRYEVWRDQRALNNPLNLFAVIVGIGLLQVAYDVFVKRHFTWRVAPATALDIAFLVLFFRRSRWAWIALPFWGAIFLIEVPFQVARASHYPLRVAVFVGCFGLVIGVGLILWGFAIRRRYYSYIGYER
jgi:hypothetical protein